MPRSKSLEEEIDWLLDTLDVTDIDASTLIDRALEDEDVPELAGIEAGWREDLLEMANDA